MTVVTQLLPERRYNNNGGITGDDKGKIAYSHTRKFRVKVTQDVDEATELDILATVGLPVVNITPLILGTGQWIPFTVCRSKRAIQNKGDRSIWDVEATYKSPTLDKEKEPEDKPASVNDISVSVESTGEIMERVAEHDINDEPILNGVDEKFAEPTMKPIGLTVLNIRFYVAEYPRLRISDELGRVNATEWETKPAYSWKITAINRNVVKIPIAGDPEAEPPVPDSEIDAVELAYTVKHTPEEHGWRDSKLQVGTHYRDNPADGPASPNKRPFLDPETQMPREDLIDENGYRTDTPVYTDFEHIEKINFNTLFPTLPDD